MSVTLHEDAISRLFSPEGPIGEYIQERALRVAVEAERLAKEIMHRAPQHVDGVGISAPDANGLIEIGTRDTGSIARYLAEKEAREWQEGKGWLVKALSAEFPN